MKAHRSGLIISALTICALYLVDATASAQRAAHQPRPHSAESRPVVPHGTPACGDVFSFQVLLDRAGFSPGEIDGAAGPNFQHALAAWREAHHLAAGTHPDCESWHALGTETKWVPVTTTYTITEADTAGPFVEDIPEELTKQAALPALGYRSAIEKLGERFHMSPVLLRKMNAGAGFTAGETIQVANVQPFDAATKPSTDPAAANASVRVTRDDSSLRVTRPDGTLIFFAPVTTGSEHDPLPPGDWKVVGVGWYPPFNYNPDLFWDAKPGDTKATIKPGPNNPVGVTWIDLSREHYGLHGTPEPGNIGHTESHGCVRLTNWDAAHLVSLVKVGTPVLFR